VSAGAVAGAAPGAAHGAPPGAAPGAAATAAAPGSQGGSPTVTTAGARPAGVRLGVDVGTVRVGVAISDPAGVLATPLMTLPRAGSIAALAALVAEHHAAELVVGLPRSLSGREGRAAELARDYAGQLQDAVGVPVRLADERLTTVIASRTLAERGVRGRRRRAVVDQAAAVLILQAWLDTRPSTGQPSTGQPSTGQPSTGQPGSGGPHAGQPSAGQRDPRPRTIGRVDADDA